MSDPTKHPEYNHAVPVLDAKNFLWSDRHVKPLGVAERSDFKGTNLNTQIFHDACDVGFAVRGKTGIKVFHLIGEEYDDDGDLLVSKYAADMNGRNGFRGDFHIHILND